MIDLDDIVAEFLVESGENLNQLDRDLVALEQEPGSRSLLGSIFRTIHTIKGTTGFLGFGHLETVTHAGESLLGRLRDGDLQLTGEITDVLLAMVDAVRALLSSIEATGAEGSPDHTGLLADLVRLQSAPPTAPAAAAPSGKAPAPADPAPAAPVPVPLLGEVMVAPALRDQADHRSVADSSVRVDVDVLDSLMRLVGELVLARNQLLARTGTGSDAALGTAAARVDVITSDLQDGVLRTRMQPIDNLLNKLPRLVRDTAATCGKTVTLVTEGGDTELDRSILEAVRDPLTHLVRNAVDHGIEPLAARRAAGKPDRGALRVHAFHAGGQVHIEVSDDGAGIDTARVAGKAVEHGLVPAAAIPAMTDREIGSLIFLPGFSTADQVTSVSGRGVGMDVVKSNVEAVGGSVEVRSEPGAGTTFSVQIPLTLAIIPALLVTCGRERYAIPQLHVLELVRLAGPTAVETVCGTPVYRLRGDLLPLLHLDRELALGAPAAAAGDGAPLVVLEAANQRFGLLVDGVLETAEIVLKPLRPAPAPPVFGGATIMGDGRVALILDVPGLARRANVLAVGRALRATAGALEAVPAHHSTGQLLLTRVGDQRVAIPLTAVERLEELPASAVERLGGRMLTQYRGGILPLLRLAEHLGATEHPGAPEQPGVAGDLQVVVHVADGRRVGLIVDEILDAVPAVPAAVPNATLVIDGRVTAVLDVGSAVRALELVGSMPGPTGAG